MLDQHDNGTRSRALRGLGTLVLGGAMTLSLVACDNAFQGGATGAMLGALGGMGLGSLSGNMGKGAAGGAIIGAIGGAILGDQNARSGRSLDY